MSLQTSIHDDMVAAMKAKDEVRLSVVRGILTACTNERTSGKRGSQDELSDDEVLDLIRRALKQRKDAAEQFRNGGREELAQSEEVEADVLQAYLPALMSTEDVAKVVEAKKAALGVTEKKDMGKLMGAVMGELKGKAEGSDVKAAVEAILE